MDSRKVYKIAFFTAMVLFLAFCLVFYLRERKNQENLKNLQNVIANQTQTIEVQKGLYEKQSLELSNLNEDYSNLLSTFDNTVNALSEQIRQRDLKIQSLNQLVVYWKKAYEGAVDANQENQGDVSDQCKEECGKLRVKVNFEKDFGFIKASGYTITNPPEGFVKVEQTRPLKLTLAVVQDKTKKWSAIVGSSEENVGVDIAVTAVNPFLEKEKWYQKIGIAASVGVGSGFMSSVGITYKIKNFDVGPMYGFYAGDNLERFFGLTVNWKPF